MQKWLLTVLSVSITATCSPATIADDIVIGAWNIEWLGRPESRSGVAKNRGQKAEDIVEYIQTGEVDILALEEICDDTPNGALDNSTIKETISLLNDRPNNRWNYQLFPKKNPENETQCVGVMWNQKKVSLEGNPETAQIPAQVDGVNIWDRGIHAIKFRLGAGKTDIVVIPVHMKSNVGGVNKTKTQRAKEAAFLIAEISKLKTTFNDSDFVILGDTNVLSGDEPAVKTIVDAGFVDLNETDVPTTYSGPAPFDRSSSQKRSPNSRSLTSGC